MAGHNNQARPHEVHFSRTSDEWPTPRSAVAELERRYGAFDLDVAADSKNTVAPRHFTINDDALTQPWIAQNAYANPPFSLIEKFVQHGIREVLTRRCQQLVYLVPARTDTRWFRELVEHAAEPPLFLSGRLRFGDATQPAPFPSVVVVLRASKTWASGDPAVEYRMPTRHGTRPLWYTMPGAER